MLYLAASARADSQNRLVEFSEDSFLRQKRTHHEDHHLHRVRGLFVDRFTLKSTMTTGARGPNYCRAKRNPCSGHGIVLDASEQAVNEILMKAKNEEIDKGNFLPSQNFLRVHDSVDNSTVFRMIRDMPKGAALHVHDTAIVSLDYVYHNLTYRPNLYVSQRGDSLRLRFFDKPKDDSWTLLSDARNETLDARIKRQLSLEVDADPDVVYPNGNAVWKKFISIFVFGRDLICLQVGKLSLLSPTMFEDYTYQGLLEFYQDNVLYYGPMEVARIYQRVAERFERDHPDFVGLKLIYAPSFVVGFDLVSQEDIGLPLVEVADQLLDLNDELPFFFHAGETNWYGSSSDENLLDAVLLNTRRIGHGYALVKHPELLEMVRRRNIAIELCPVSNQVLALVRDQRNHPATTIPASGLLADSVTIFTRAFLGIMSRRADLKVFKKLVYNSIQYSAMSKEDKWKALDIWLNKWQAFINKYFGTSFIEK
ncbi:unnamed protein product [Trichogramma brassicae]|uniref:Adenosine deaminase n=1 Tax=Trichogramma brassicae TaxID=86971 RepID=A0A6H5IMR9_9HYME|nr:unnamed protein product [Trichogramma brassicae]